MWAQAHTDAHTVNKLVKDKISMKCLHTTLRKQECEQLTKHLAKGSSETKPRLFD